MIIFDTSEKEGQNSDSRAIPINAHTLYVNSYSELFSCSINIIHNKVKI